MTINFSKSFIINGEIKWLRINAKVERTEMRWTRRGNRLHYVVRLEDGRIETVNSEHATVVEA